ncbi:MAG: DNA polymerase III subunit delta [Bifidobacterium sp.]|nr:DNA polymerase III subunit delta [Bifidobacterium sp.]
MAARTPHLTLVLGGDEYLNVQQARTAARQALEHRPDLEDVTLDASHATGHDLEQAVSPSLLGDGAVVTIDRLQDADDSMAHALLDYAAHPDASIVIARHDGSPKGKGLVDRLRKAGAHTIEVPKLDKPQAQLNYTLQRFEGHGRRVEPQAAQRLADVLGGKPGELAAMVDQLCFDFPDGPIGMDQVDAYLVDDPQVTGFAVADTALAGQGARAVMMMRSAVAQGMEPIALIGALAMKCRQLAKVAALRAGDLDASTVHMPSWMVRNTQRQLSGWTSAGLARCIRRLAWADEQCKTNGADPDYALEQCIELLARKGMDAGKAR